MCKRNETFIALALYFILFCDSTSSECTQLAPCVCSLPDGQYYNLTELADKELLTNKEDVLPSVKWYFHPCKDALIKLPDPNSTECSKGKGVSLCMYDEKSKMASSLGTIQETQMKLSNDNNKIPVFEIHHGNSTSVIKLLCLDDSETQFAIYHISDREYHFILTSPHACKIKPHKELSTGSVLVILLIVFSGIYFIGGVVALKFLRGATSWEMLPNHHFWCELPSLVRDGIIFTFNCCRADSYERI